MSFYPKDVLAGVPDIYFAEQCLFLMQIGKSYYDRLYAVCRDLLLQEGIQCRRADELRGSDAIIVDIVREIKLSGVVLADISELNPNVLYEVGIAHCVKDEGNTILISNEPVESLPFDLQHLRFHLYSREDPGAAQDIVDLIVKKFVSIRPGISGKRVLGFEAVQKSELSATEEVWVATHHLFAGPWAAVMARNFTKEPPVKYRVVLPEPSVVKGLKESIQREIEGLICDYDISVEVLLSRLDLYTESTTPPMEFFVHDPDLAQRRTGFLTISDHTAESDYTFVSIEEDQLQYMIE